MNLCGQATFASTATHMPQLEPGISTVTGIARRSLEIGLLHRADEAAGRGLRSCSVQPDCDPQETNHTEQIED